MLSCKGCRGTAPTLCWAGAAGRLRVWLVPRQQKKVAHQPTAKAQRTGKLGQPRLKAARAGTFHPPLDAFRSHSLTVPFWPPAATTSSCVSKLTHSTADWWPDRLCVAGGYGASSGRGVAKGRPALLRESFHKL